VEVADVRSSPYQVFLGIELRRVDADGVEMFLPFRQEFLRESGSDWLHGGIVSALIDIAGNYAVQAQVGPGVPTVDMRVDYLRPSRGDLTATATVVKLGKRTALSDVRIHDPNGNLVAVGRVLYAIPQKS
jgi:uncharacterized protein (TIGR00369 family)